MKILPIIGVAAVGSIFTLLVQAVLAIRSRRYIKKSIQIFLNDVILPICKTIRSETPVVIEAISTKYPGENVKLGMHPAFNSRFLKAYSMDKLQPIYKDNLKEIIDIIAILDNLESRLPLHGFNEYVKKSESHVDKNYEKEKDLYSSKKEHFDKCPAIQGIRDISISNLSNVVDIINSLEENIDRLKKE